MKNPFYYQGFAPKEFCLERSDDIRRLRESADNGQRIRIRGDRRIGKTTLVNQALGRSRILIKVDFGAVRTLKLANERILIALQKASKKKSWVAKIANILGSINEVKLGPISLKTSGGGGSDEASLSRLLDLIGDLGSKQKVAVFFDEIQDLMDVDGSESYLWELRGITQSQHEIPYVFAGSNRHMMHRMFDHSKAPFFKQTYDFELNAIEKETFVKWVAQRFASAGKPFDTELVEHVYRVCRGVAGDVQCVAYHMFESKMEGEEAFIGALKNIIEPKAGSYQSVLTSLKRTLKLQLKAIAVMGGKQPTGTRVAGSLGLNSGAANAAISGLEKRGLIFDQGNGVYVFDDPFFRLWLMALDPLETQRMFPESEDWPIVSKLVWD